MFCTPQSDLKSVPGRTASIASCSCYCATYEYNVNTVILELRKNHVRILRQRNGAACWFFIGSGCFSAFKGFILLVDKGQTTTGLQAYFV